MRFFKRYGSLVSFSSLFRWWLFAVRQGRGSHAFTRSIQIRLKAPYSQCIRFRPISNDSYTFDEIFVDQVYKQVADRLSASAYVLDAGANIGFATIFLNTWCGPVTRSVCVEPDESNLCLLRYNIGPLLSRDKAAVYGGALWGADGVVQLGTLEQGHVNQRACTALTGKMAVNGGVRAYAVQSILQRENIPFLDLLKMDIEGGEVDVFAGDVSWLDKVRVLAIEFHGDSRKQSGFDAIMDAHGFTVTDADSSHTIMAIRDAV